MIQCGYIEYILIEYGLKRYIHPTTKLRWTLKLSFKMRNLLVVTHGGVFYFYLKRECYQGVEKNSGLPGSDVKTELAWLLPAACPLLSQHNLGQ